MRVVEVFYVFVLINFVFEGMSVIVLEDKKSFLVVGDVIVKDKENIICCWKFDKLDLIGKYEMEV